LGKKRQHTDMPTPPQTFGEDHPAVMWQDFENRFRGRFLGLELNVKPREIVYTFFEEFRVFFLPVFEGLDG